MTARARGGAGRAWVLAQRSRRLNLRRRPRVRHSLGAGPSRPLASSVSIRASPAERRADQPGLAQIGFVGLRYKLAVTQHDHALADQRELLAVGRRDQNAGAEFGCASEHLEDPGLPANVDA